MALLITRPGSLVTVCSVSLSDYISFIYLSHPNPFLRRPCRSVLLSCVLTEFGQLVKFISYRAVVYMLMQMYWLSVFQFEVAGE